MSTVAGTAAIVPLPQSRLIATEIPGPNSRALAERRAAVVARGVSLGSPVYAARAHGGIIEDVDGNRFLDMTSGIGVVTVGHTDEAVVEAARAELGRLTHTMFPTVPYESYVRVAELLAEHTPGGFPKKSVIVSTGAEAVENAVKIARRFTGRPGVAVLDHGYHGRTNLTMAMTYKAHPYSAGFGPFASDVVRAPGSYPFRDGLTGPEAAARTIAILEKTYGAEHLACIVVEPVQGEGGFIVPADGYLAAIAEWARANGVLFVADEIQSGIARTGYWYAVDHEGVVPDLVATAKGVAGGLPLAAVTGRADVMDASGPGGLGGTFGGNPVACAAAIAVFERIESAGLLGRARAIGELLLPELRRLQAAHPAVGDVRGRGAMLAIELVNAQGEPDAAAVGSIIAFALQRGVVLLSAGSDGNVLRFLPNLATSDELLLEAVAVLDEALASL
ncbi:MAG: 4-aminobutyrate--2-oxoglutarate transaminase [Microbacteriaceae bacterium]|nr:4-aminobutyrate--2-oxoglutarate transaminase [Microbacteriaceae bacterium]